MIASPWLTAAEAAQYARMDYDTVRQALAAGKLRGLQASKGAKWRTRAEWVDAWLSGEVAELTVPRVARGRAS